MQTGEIIAANLKRIRGERNLSLGQLAKMSGVSKALLYLMEDGDSNPTIDTLLKIAKALHLSYANLLELPEAQVILRKKTDLSAFRGEDYLASCGKQLRIHNHDERADDTGDLRGGVPSGNGGRAVL